MERILYPNIESEIRKHWGQSGTWKHSLVMKLAKELGSLRFAWKYLKSTEKYIKFMATEKPNDTDIDTMDFMDWVKKIETEKIADVR